MLNGVVFLLVFIFGNCVGSFLNVIVLRYNTGNSPFKGGSRCFFCGKKLYWYELVPVVSFLIQRGKCRECQSKISWQYPTIEIITGLLFLLILNFKFLIFKTLFLWIVVSLLIIIAVYDLRHKIIPNLFVWLFNGLVFGYLIFEFVSPASPRLVEAGDFGFWILDFGPKFLSGLAFSAFFALLWAVSKGKWMGFGDAKLALGLGWLLGPTNTFSAFMFSFFLGTVVGIGLMIFNKNKYSMKSQIPFGPFLIAGSLLALYLNVNVLDYLIFL